MSDKFPGGYKHLSGAEKLKRKAKQIEDDALLAKRSAPFFARFKQVEGAVATLRPVVEEIEHETHISLDNVSENDYANADAGESLDLEQSSDAVDPIKLDDCLPTNEKTIQNTHVSIQSRLLENLEYDTGSHVAQWTDPGLQPNDSDPALWSLPISAGTRRRLVSNGPFATILHRYLSRNGHRFDSALFTFNQHHILHKRDWLIYSNSANSLFCFPCSLFEDATSLASPFQLSLLNRAGFTDFLHKRRGVEAHEMTQRHYAATTAWVMFKNKLKDATLIDNVSEKVLQSEISFWNQVLRVVLDAVIFLAKNNLPFRGNSSNLEDSNCGNFLSLIKLLSKYSPAMEKHLERLTKHATSYLSPMVQNEFITQCGTWVKQYILQEVREAKYFSIMVDATPDDSKKEQVSQVLRYLKCGKQGCEVRERFVDFIATEEKTGKGLSDVIIEKLNTDNFDIQSCRGQGYDNGANMSGVYNGVQSWILGVSPKASYIPCAAHSLNLVGVNAAERVLPAKLSLGQIQNLFLFFHASTSRWQFLNAKLNCTLQGQSSTRWSSRADAVHAPSSQYWNVVEALLEMTTNHAFNSDTVAGADALLNVLLSFKLLLSVKIWSQVLYKINLCNLTLQQETKNLQAACTKLEALVS